MRAVLGLFERLWLLTCVLGAGCLPGFILQYRQRLLGRLDQVTFDLAPWRAIAARHHNGSLDALIAHHRASADPTFVDEAQAIEMMLQSETSLRESINAIQGNLFEQTYGWITHVEWADAQAVWTLYQPTFPLDADGLVFAMSFGVLLWLLPVSLVWLWRRRLASKAWSGHHMR